MTKPVTCPDCGHCDDFEAFDAEESEGVVLSCPECGHTDLGEEFS